MSTSDQKLYTEFWHSPLSFYLLLDAIDSKFKRHLDNKSKERFHNQRVCESKCRRTKAFDKDIFITYRFSDRKLSQPITTSSELLEFETILQFIFSQTLDKFHVNEKLE